MEIYSVIKAVFSGGFSEVCFHQNSLEMLHLRRERGGGGSCRQFKIREGLKIRKEGRDTREMAHDFI